MRVFGQQRIVLFALDPASVAIVSLTPGSKIAVNPGKSSHDAGSLTHFHQLQKIKSPRALRNHAIVRRPRPVRHEGRTFAVNRQKTPNRVFSAVEMRKNLTLPRARCTSGRSPPLLALSAYPAGREDDQVLGSQLSPSSPALSARHDDRSRNSSTRGESSSRRCENPIPPSRRCLTFSFWKDLPSAPLIVK